MPDYNTDKTDDHQTANNRPDTRPDLQRTRERPFVVAPDTDLHKIVVVGGGAGGLELVTKLGDKLGRKGKAHVTLIERSRTHIWKPLLHEIAAGSMDVARHELSYLAQAHWHGFQYRYGEMIGLDREKRLVHCAATFDEEGREITPPRSFPYDTLVIAIGSVSNDFSTPGVQEHAIMLDTPEQAERFNRRLVNACLRANTHPDPIEPGQLPQVEEDEIVACLKKHGDLIAGFHRIRTRKAGSQRYIDFHLVVSRQLSVERAHHLCDQLEQEIEKRLSNTSVTIHVEPCDGNCEKCSTSPDLCQPG